MADLRKSWQRLTCQLNMRSNDLDLHDALVARYLEPHRRYHSLQHLIECLTWFESVANLAIYPAEIEAALWFHDAIYEPTQPNNEELSAIWARDALRERGVSAAAVTRIQQLVLATQHAAIPTLPDEQLLVDIDLAILGSNKSRFDEYEQQIKEEYTWVPENGFRERRQEILRAFLERKHIYSTQHFRDMLEQQARANLRWAIAKNAPAF
jgi:predicted metal-dependent HD superfamily phosphohydrolase